MKSNKKPWDLFFLPLAIIQIVYLLVYGYFFLTFNIHKFPSTQLTADKKNHSVLLVSSKNSYAERQESFHNCKAINNLGHNCYIFEFTNCVLYNPLYRFYISQALNLTNHFVKPDFIFYNDPLMNFNKTSYPSYGVVDVGQMLSIYLDKNIDLDTKAIKRYELLDGLVFYGNNTKWAKKIVSELEKKDIHLTSNAIFNIHPSVPRTHFTKNERNSLFYSGTNWDTRRNSEHYKEIHKLLDTKGYYTVYGPENKWNFLEHSYKGSIAFDTDSVIKTLEQSGISLLLHSDFHNQYGIPSKRIFEAAAAGAVIISDKNPFVVKEFGDCVYYIDPSKKPIEVVKDIDKIVQLIKSDPELANKKAACVHNIFIKKFTLEKQWERVFAMHKKISKS